MISCDQSECNIEGNMEDLQIELYSLMYSFNKILTSKVGTYEANTRMRSLLEMSLLYSKSDDEEKRFSGPVSYKIKISEGRVS